MKKIIVFIILTVSIFSENLENLWTKHNLVFSENGLYTGEIRKDNMISNVVLGVIIDFSFVNGSELLLRVPVKNNRFHGVGKMIHGRLGELKLHYDQGYIVKVEGDRFYEIWQANTFIEGRDRNEVYKDISKNPYIEFFDEYSFNTLQNYFDLTSIENGLIKMQGRRAILDKSKIIKEYRIYNENLELSLPLIKNNYRLISLKDIEAGLLYQARFVDGKIEILSYSDKNGLIFIEEFRNNQFFRGRDLRNALFYFDSQLKNELTIIKSFVN